MPLQQRPCSNKIVQLERKEEECIIAMKVRMNRRSVELSPTMHHRIQWDPNEKY